MADVTTVGKAPSKDTNGDGAIEKYSMYASTAWYLRICVIWAHGGDMLTPDYSEFIMNKPEAVADLQWIADSIAQLGPAGRSVRTATGAHAIWSGTKNPDEAWNLIKFLSTKETQLAMAKKGTIIPALRTAAFDPKFVDGPPKNRRVFMDSVGQWGRIDQVTTVFNQMNPEIDKALSPVWSGQKSVENAMNELKPIMDQLLKQAQR